MDSLKSSILSLARAFFLVLIATSSVVWMTSDVALAHNSISASSPTNNEVLTASPAEWEITFAKSVPLNSASGQLITQDGVRRNLEAPRHGMTDNIIIFQLPEKIAGQATARWRLVSTDGHVVSGRVTFTVTDSNAPNDDVTPTPTDTPSDSLIDSSDTNGESFVLSISKPAVRFATFLALVVFGGLVFAQWQIASGAMNTPHGGRLSKISASSLFVLPILALAFLVTDLRDSSDGWLDAFSTALSFDIGAMTVFRIAVGLLLFFFIRTLVDQKVVNDQNLVWIAALVIMYCVALAYSGHSRSQRFPWLGIPVDVIHTLAISAWLGGLLVLLMIILPAISSAQSIDAFLRFSNAAERAVVLIVVTGVIQTFRLHGISDSLVTSRHGLLLIAKVCVVVLMLRLAYMNRKYLLKRHSAHNEKQQKITVVRQSTLEVILGGAAMGITTFLVTAPLP